MNEEAYLTILYDYYGELLKEDQKKYFEEYYFNNLSLGEMSENFEVSRNAIHKQLKKIELLLKDYESKLKLYQKGQELDSIIQEIKDEKLKEKLIKLNQ